MNHIHYDSIIIGSGSMGSAAAYYLSKSGQKVLCLDQFSAPHAHGSHSGQTRIIRKAYFEHEAYVPLLDRAYENWKNLETESGSALFFKTGLLYIGSDDSHIIKGVSQTANQHHINLLQYDSKKLSESYEMIHAPVDNGGILEPEAGFLLPNESIRTLKRLAELNGVEFHDYETVLNWSIDNKKLEVLTNKAVYEADKLIICAGAWSKRLLSQLQIDLTVSRQHLAWFDIGDNPEFQIDNFPCFMIDDQAGLFYGFPALPKNHLSGPYGLKIALHRVSDLVDYPDHQVGSQTMTLAEESLLKSIVTRYFPTISPEIIHQSSCYYTNSADSDFIIDFYPGTDQKVLIACGFSGHGFKFVPAIGEILKNMAVGKDIGLDLDFLSLARFKGFKAL